MDEVNPGLGQRTRCVDDLADTVEVVMVAAEVGDAVQTIWAGEVQNAGIASFVPGDLLCGNQVLAKRQSFAEYGKW